MTKPGSSPEPLPRASNAVQDDFSWIDCDVLDARGAPVQQLGVTSVPGLYFLGLPRMHKIKSSFLWGVGEDAEYLAEHIAGRC